MQFHSVCHYCWSGRRRSQRRHPHRFMHSVHRHGKRLCPAVLQRCSTRFSRQPSAAHSVTIVARSAPYPSCKTPTSVTKLRCSLITPCSPATHSPATHSTQPSRTLRTPQPPLTRRSNRYAACVFTPPPCTPRRHSPQPHAAHYVASDSSSAVPRMTQWSGSAAPERRSTCIMNDGRSRVPVRTGYKYSGHT